MRPLRYALCLLVILGVAGGALLHVAPVSADDAIVGMIDGDDVAIVAVVDEHVPLRRFVVERREPSVLHTVAEILIDAPKTSPPRIA